MSGDWILHRGSEVREFCEKYFGQRDRNVALIAGAGFDPRSGVIAEMLATIIPGDLSAIFLRELRPHPESGLQSIATDNAGELARIITQSATRSINVLSEDNAVTAGREAVKAVREEFDGRNVTDVIIDLSALSMGVSLPLLRYFHKLTTTEAPELNLHAMIAHSTELDANISRETSDKVTPIHGYDAEYKLRHDKGETLLWLPQLAPGLRATFERMYEFLDPDEVCPILPFPTRNPRLGDDLLREYLPLIEDAWEVEPGDLVYASEESPLDLYRTLLKVSEERDQVHQKTGGSLVVVSPAGAKLPALGAALAAIRSHVALVYTERLDYELEGQAERYGKDAEPEVIHLWVSGDPYDGGIRSA